MKIYKFEKKGCGPCRMAGMMIEKSAKKYGVEVVSFDVVENPDLLAQYEIKTVPSVLVMNDSGDEILHRLTNFGAISNGLEQILRTGR